MRDLALQQPTLNKILSHIKRHMQDADATVRDASVDALVALADAAAQGAGSLLPGSAAANPFLRAALDCLGEHMKEAQTAAALALHLMAPLLQPLDREHVKALLRCLRSGAFQGTAALLVAIANTGGADGREAGGLLKYGASAFVPYLQHLIGQPAAASSSGGGGGVRDAGGSSILGCLSKQDWAVRRSAADAISATALLLGPEMEPEGAWSPGDPNSVTGRCLAALEPVRFDKVKEARACAREAAGVLQELQRFAVEEPGGDWVAAASVYAGGWAEGMLIGREVGCVDLGSNVTG